MLIAPRGMLVAPRGMLVAHRGMLVAHRGGVLHTDIKENSLEAFDRAMSYYPKVGGIEFDIRKTKDNILVVAHDPTISTGQTRSCESKHQYIDTLMYDDIKELGICTLDEVLDIAYNKHYDGELNIEIKDYDITDLLISTIKKYQTLKFFITSFLHFEIDKFYTQFSKYLQDKENETQYVYPKLGYLFASYPYNINEILTLTYSYFDKVYPMKIVLNDKSLPRHKDHPQMQLLLNHSQNISVYTVNMPEDVTFYQSQCGFNVITDEIKNENEIY